MFVKCDDLWLVTMVETRSHAQPESFNF